MLNYLLLRPTADGHNLCLYSRMSLDGRHVKERGSMLDGLLNHICGLDLDIVAQGCLLNMV